MSNANVNLEYFVPVSQYVIGSVHLSASMHFGVQVLLANIKTWELWFHWGINARIFSESCVAVFWSYSTLLLPVCGIAHLSSATPTTLLYQVCSLDIDILAKYLLCLFCCSFEIFSDRSLALSTQSADLWFCIFYIFGIHLPVINVLRYGTHLCPMVLSGLTWLSCPSILW